jgi:antitoxin VapB
MEAAASIRFAMSKPSTNAFYDESKAETRLPGATRAAIYLRICQESEVINESRSQNPFMHNHSQAVRLPEDFQFNTQVVFICKQGDDVILSPRPQDWSDFLASGPVASEGFEDLPAN